MQDMDERKDSSIDSELALAVSSGNIQHVRSLLSFGVCVNSNFGPTAKTQLHRAAEIGDDELVELFLENDYRVDVGDADSNTALSLAVQNNKPSTVSILLNYGFNVNHVNVFDMTPLQIAASNGSVVVIRILLEDKNILVDLPNKRGSTAIHFAVASGHHLAASALLLQNANLNIKNICGVAPLHISAYNCDFKSMKLLLDKGAMVDITNNDGATPFIVASMRGNSKVVKLLLDYGAYVNMPDNSGHTALFVASRFGHKNLVSNLLKQLDIFVNFPDNSGVTALQAACKFGHFDVAKILIEHGAEVNLPDFSGISPLHLAVRYGHVDVVIYLLESSALPNHSALVLGSPVIIAGTRGDLSMLSLLKRYGGDLKAVIPDTGVGLFHIAAFNGDLNLSKLLIESGVDISLRDKYGEMPIHVAAQKGHNHIIKYFLSQGADVDSFNDRKLTPLIYAVNSGHDRTILLLIEFGAKIDLVNYLGKSALHLSLEKGFENIALLLIESGANFNFPDEGGITASQLAIEKSYYSIFEKMIEVSKQRGEFLIVGDEVGDIKTNQYTEEAVFEDDIYNIADALLRMKYTMPLIVSPEAFEC